MDWLTIIAVITPLVLMIYLLITDYVNLYPLNDVKKHTPHIRKIESLNYFVPAIAAGFSWIGNLIVPFIVAALFFLGNIYSWWLPYFFGCSEKRKQRYQEAFGNTIKILPPIKDHPVPNLEHMIVSALIVIWFAVIALKSINNYS